MAVIDKEHETNVKFLQVTTAMLCLLGLILSFYAYHVETQKEADKTYSAMCDISEHMSCTTAFSSKYGKGFGFVQLFLNENSLLVQPNSIYGVLFYSGFMPLSEVPSLAISRLVIFMALVSNLCSIYLAYILIFILYDFCVVCVATYIVNALLLVCSIFRYKFLVIELEMDSHKKEN